MITVRTEVYVKGISGKSFTDFMLNCDDDAYRNWWPGTHLAFHTLKRYPGDTGNVVYMDEYVGKYRVRMKGLVIKAVPGKEITWQFKKLIKLPVRLSLVVEDDGGGAHITHTIFAGFNGIGAVLNPLFRLYFSGSFVKAMDDHARSEFSMLAGLLR
jgi:hypothetical protein